jgi:transcriptional regulator with XRE-family HTH domain
MVIVPQGAQARHAGQDKRVVPALGLRRVREGLGLSRERMARVLSVSARSIENWERADRLPPDEAKRRLFATIAQIYDLALTVYTPEGVVAFMTTPMKAFGYHTALHEIEAGRADRVLGELAADYEGGGY